MATRNEWDELQYHSKENWNDAYNNKQDRKHNNVITNDDVAHRTSTIAWRITTCTEFARIVSQSLIITLTFMAQAESCTFHPISTPSTWLSLFDSTYSTLYFSAFLLSVFLFPFFHLSDEQQPELNKKFMENLHNSANNGGEGTYDVLHLPTKSVRSSFARTVMGKAILRKSYCSTVGRRFPIGNACSYTVKKGYSYLCMWKPLNWLERNKNIDPMWKLLNKEIDLGEPTSFLDHVYLGRTQRQCEISKDIVDIYRTMFESRISAVRIRESYHTRKYSYFFIVLRYGGSCKEMCGTILWVGKQDDSTTPQSIYSMHRWPSLQRGRIKICWRIVKSMLSNCSKMRILFTYWKTWYSMASEQTCTIDYKMDQCLWQTPESIDILHSSHMWIHTVLLCG